MTERESGKCQLVLLPSAHYDRVQREINGVAPFTRHVHVIHYGDGQYRSFLILYLHHGIKEVKETYKSMLNVQRNYPLCGSLSQKMVLKSMSICKCPCLEQ